HRRDAAAARGRPRGDGRPRVRSRRAVAGRAAERAAAVGNRDPARAHRLSADRLSRSWRRTGCKGRVVAAPRSGGIRPGDGAPGAGVRRPRARGSGPPGAAVRRRRARVVVGRRARARFRTPGIRHREAPELHDAVVYVRRDGCGAMAVVHAATSRGAREAPVMQAERIGAKATPARAKRLVMLIAAIAVAPVILSYLAYYALPHDSRVNYGTLMARPFHDVAGTPPHGK